MAKWTNAVITDFGKALENKVLFENTIEITKVVAGEGTVKLVDLRKQTALVSEKQTLSVNKFTSDNDTATVSVLLTVVGLKESYNLQQIGFYANDPDNGEILFAIAQSEEATVIPTEDEVPMYSIEFHFHFAITNDVNLHVTTDVGAFVTNGIMEERLSAIIEEIRIVDNKADAANTAAENAQSTADSAKKDASTAQSTADTANNAAANAQTTADSAITAASKAQSTADAAQTVAANAQSTADTATNIAKGRNQAHVFSTTAEMQAWLSNSENKNKYNKGDNIYIVEIDVPDWWVAEVLDTADPETGYYYKLGQLETQKVDLTNIEEEIAANATAAANAQTTAENAQSTADSAMEKVNPLYLGIDDSYYHGITDIKPSFLAMIQKAKQYSTFTYIERANYLFPDAGTYICHVSKFADIGNLAVVFAINRNKVGNSYLISTNSDGTDIETFSKIALASDYIRTDGANYQLNPVGNVDGFLTGIGIFSFAENLPTFHESVWYKVESVSSGDVCIQTATHLYTGYQYFRYYVGNAWTAWTNVKALVDGSGNNIESTYVKKSIGAVQDVFGSRNFNDYKVSGFYKFDTIGSTFYENEPNVPSYGQLIVSHNSDTTLQIACGFGNDPIIAYRCFNDAFTGGSEWNYIPKFSLNDDVLNITF